MTVTLADVKNYLRYEAGETEQDDALSIMLAGAQNWVEQHTHKAFGDYDSPDDIPAVMLQAMCLIVGMNDEDRADLGAGTTAVEWLLADYHRPALA